MSGVSGIGASSGLGSSGTGSAVLVMASVMLLVAHVRFSKSQRRATRAPCGS